MDMNKNILKVFCKYQQTVLFEEAEFTKFSDTIITDPLEKLVSYYIFEQHFNNKNPSQTDILYELRITHSTLRKILKRLIVAGYIAPCEQGDARFTHYKPTEMVIEGFKIHTARHYKTLLKLAGELGNKADYLDYINDTVDELLGSYAKYTAYGDMSIDTVKSILDTLETKKHNSVAN